MLIPLRVVEWRKEAKQGEKMGELNRPSGVGSSQRTLTVSQVTDRESTASCVLKQ
jgi:hypothetical protein